MKDFMGGNSAYDILFPRGAILDEDDIAKHPWLRRSIASGTLVAVDTQEPTVRVSTLKPAVEWHNPVLDEDPFN